MTAAPAARTTWQPPPDPGAGAAPGPLDPPGERLFTPALLTALVAVAIVVILAMLGIIAGARVS